ncbi:hypothetical protein FBU30_010908 [Linnemannia zychae]|nr:hypothetical protein FBU30_010908 [Linnemannia zychae]
MVPPPPAAAEHRPLGVDASDAEDAEGTPRVANQSIGHKSSTETLKAKKSKPSAVTLNTSTSDPNNNQNNRQHRPTASSTSRPTSRSPSKEPTQPTFSDKLGLSKKKKKRLQREEEEREERRLKEEANEAMRRKHGEYYPPGHSQGLVHTHRIPQQHDHHHLERSRSGGNLHTQYQQQKHSFSSSRVASPTPRSPSRASTQRSASRASTQSSASSLYSNSRNGSYIQQHGVGNYGRSTGPMGEIVSLPSDYFHTHPHMNVLEGLDAEGMLSEHWDTNSDDEDENLSHYNDQDSHDPQRKVSIDTSASYKTNGSSSMVWVPQRPLSPSSVASSRASRSRHHHQSSISQQLGPDSRLSNDQPHPIMLEMSEVNDSGKPHHQSWPLNNMSTTGIVTGLSPEFDGHHDDMQRPHSSLSRYHSSGRSGGGGGSKYKDSHAERYLYHARSSSPTNSNLHSSTSNHRSRPHYYRHSRNNSSHIDGSESNNNTTCKNSSDISPSSTAVAAAAEALRAKAGSRATHYHTHRSSKTGNTDTWSAHETVVSNDEHNYLAPLPPFQQGPAYTRVPKRKYCKFFCGGCRWWVLLLVILIPAGLIAVATAFLLHWFRVCIAIDPNTVDPIVYTIDPTVVQAITLDYQTRTSGIINIVDSPSKTETKVIMKLRRQFYNMKNRQDLTGFKVSNIDNGVSRYVMDDEANKHREFFISSVLCSDSILTIEMPRPSPSISNATRDIGLDISLDQQDVFVNLDPSLHRNATWKFRGVSNRNMNIQSLNINTLMISYTSTSPANVQLQSVLVKDQLSVMSVSGNINASIGFDTSAATSSSSSSSTTTTPTLGGTSGSKSTTVNLNTMDGQILLDLSRAWNQSSTFQINAPDVQITKSGSIVLPFGGFHNSSTQVNVNGLYATEGQHSWTGSFSPAGADPLQPPLPRPPSSLPGVPSSTATTTSASLTSPTITTTTTAITTTTTTTTTRSATATPGSALGAGGWMVPAQLMIQANKNVAVNFP